MASRWPKASGRLIFTLGLTQTVLPAVHGTSIQ